MWGVASVSRSRKIAMKFNFLRLNNLSIRPSLGRERERKEKIKGRGRGKGRGEREGGRERRGRLFSPYYPLYFFPFPLPARKA